LWDAATGRPLGRPLRHQGRIFVVEFSPDGRAAATGGADGTARLWDAATGRPLGEPLRHQGMVWAATFSPDGRVVLTGSGDENRGEGRLWDAATARPIGEPLRHQGAVMAAAFSPDGRAVLTGGTDGMARLWDAATGRPLGQPLRHHDAVTAAAFSPDGRAVLTSSLDGAARLWDTATGRPLRRPLRHQGRAFVVAFSADSRTAVTSGAGGTARLWDAATGRAVGQPLRHDDAVTAAAFSPDGRAVLTGSFDGTARLWDAATGRPLGQPLQHQAGVWAAAFSPDGRAAATGGADGTARLWDAATGRPLRQLLRHQGRVFVIAFSPDGSTVLTGGEDGAARLWDAASGQALGQPLRHQGTVLAAAFSPDGRAVLTGSADQTARLWHLAELPDDVPRLAAWIETLTGLELDQRGGIRVLHTAEWAERRRRLEQLGGPPVMAADELFDPVLFGPEPTARARSLMERGLWDEAEAALSEAVRIRPNCAALWLERGRYYAGRSQPERAAADFARALDLAPEDRRWSSPRSAMILDLVRWEGAYARLLELRPADGYLWTGRGRYHAVRDRWDRAAADFARGIASAPPDSGEWFEHACLRLLVGDVAGYREFVREMWRREGRTDDPVVAFILARSCIVAPDPVVEPERAIRWAEQAVASERNAWNLHVLGAAYYRAGHYDEAIRRLEESNAGDWKGDRKTQNRLVLAMAYHRLVEATKARALLDEVAEMWNTIEAEKVDGAVSIPATDWLPLQVYRREAEALILDGGFPADPFAR
jgi:WD40 repeat protein